MQLKPKILPILAVLLSLFSCNRVYKNNFARNEERLRTDDQRYFHELVVPPPPVHERIDGAILGFEKIRNGRISSAFKSKKHLLAAYQLNFEKFYIDSGYPKLARQTARLFSNRKTLVLTHSLRIQKGKKTIDYNIYDNKPQEWHTYDLYTAGKIAVDSLHGQLNRQIKSGRYTHLVLMSTGWNNTQSHSVERYNEWMDSIASNATADGFNFRPLYVGITWPSFWGFGKKQIALDFINVSKFSDRLGAAQVNYLLWNVMVPLANDNNLPLVLIGHSLGARILTRAAWSGNLFNNPGKTDHQINLLIALQGAYPYNRHLRLKPGKDGSLYSFGRPVGKMVATASIHDNALSKAFWASYLGNLKSVRLLKNTDSANIALNSIDSLGFAPPDTLLSPITLYDASAIIPEHGAVGNPQVARFMWQMIKQHAMRRGN